MITIYRYELSPTQTKYDIPMGAKILSAGVKFNDICVWAEVDTEAKLIQKTIKVFGTGCDMGDIAGLKFIDTVFISEFVFHIYEDQR